MAVPVGPQRRLGVVDVQRPEAVQADRSIGGLEHRLEARCCADVVAGGEQVAGVEAQPEPGRAARGLDQRVQLLERASERPARAGGVLEVQRAGAGLGERLGDHSAGVGDGVGQRPVLGRAGVQHDAGRADRVADAQGVRERRQRLGPQVRIVGGAVDQVDGMDHDCPEIARVHGLPKGGEVLVRVGGGTPHPRGLAEDLDRLAAQLGAALHRQRQAAGVRDVGADQHGTGRGSGGTRRATITA